jgi:hypothetical protein
MTSSSSKHILTDIPQFLKHALQIRYRTNPPRTLGERRQVLDAIQSEFGDVIVFKSFCVSSLSRPTTFEAHREIVPVR